MGPESPEEAQDGAKMGPRWAQDGSRSPKQAQDGPKKGPKWAQDGPKIGLTGLLKTEAEKWSAWAKEFHPFLKDVPSVLLVFTENKGGYHPKRGGSFGAGGPPGEGI